MKNRPVNFAHELPDRAMCDRFALYLVEQIHGREKLSKEIEILLRDNDRADKERLRGLREAKEFPQIDTKSIGRELIALSLPYKDELEGIWYQQSINKNRLISIVGDFGWLFNIEFYQ